MNAAGRGPRIAVVGGGLGGLLLARVLHLHGIEVVVHERDDRSGSRAQGGMLDLHRDTGQRALVAAGLQREFEAVARREGQDLRLLDPSGRLLLEQLTAPDAPLERPEVDRSDLRALLLDSLPAGTVRWGSTFRAATPRPGGGWHLELADGSRSGADLLVGADGARSRVRPLLSAVEPEPTGQHVVELQIPDVDRTRPDLAALVGRGNYWVLGEGRSLSAQRNGSGCVRVYVSLEVDPGLDPADPVRGRAAVRDLFDDWAPEVGALLAACDDTFWTRTITMLPVGFRWPGTPGVTLLGDAAHLMPPVGLGANLALLDAAELALAVASTPDDLDGAVERYEAAMFPRAEAAAEESLLISRMVAAGADALVAVLG